MPVTPTTQNGTPARASATSAVRGGLAGDDTDGPLHLPREQEPAPVGPKHPRLVAARPVPGLRLEPAGQPDQFVGHGAESSPWRSSSRAARVTARSPRAVPTPAALARARASHCASTCAASGRRRSAIVSASRAVASAQPRAARRVGFRRACPDRLVGCSGLTGFARPLADLSRATRSARYTFSND